jgi:hypothetical protein
VLVWINGAFGVGRSTTAAALVDAAAGYRLFDPEHVGYMLMSTQTTNRMTQRGSDDVSATPATNDKRRLTSTSRSRC